MKADGFSAPSASSRSFLVSLTLLLRIAVTTGCGSSAPTPPKFSGNTSVTVLLSSTANDQVTLFDLAFQRLTLTSQSGNTVTLLSSQQPAEFMHLNGGIEPLMTASVPQGIYTSATATLQGAVFVCIAQVPGGRTRNLELFNRQSGPDGELVLANYGYGQQHGVTAQYAGFQFGAFFRLLDLPSV